jgi:hypothetical protein
MPRKDAHAILDTPLSTSSDTLEVPTNPVVLPRALQTVASLSHDVLRLRDQHEKLKRRLELEGGNLDVQLLTLSAEEEPPAATLKLMSCVLLTERQLALYTGSLGLVEEAERKLSGALTAARQVSFNAAERVARYRAHEASESEVGEDKLDAALNEIRRWRGRMTPSDSSSSLETARLLLDRSEEIFSELAAHMEKFGVLEFSNHPDFLRNFPCSRRELHGRPVAN